MYCLQHACNRVTAEGISCEQKTVRNCTKHRKKHLILKDHRTNKARTTRDTYKYTYLCMIELAEEGRTHIHTFCDGRLNSLKYL